MVAASKEKEGVEERNKPNDAKPSRYMDPRITDSDLGQIFAVDKNGC